MLKVHTYPLGPIETNCYIIRDENNQCLVIDPGEEGSRIINVLKKKELTPIGILLTHAHFDHIGAVDKVRDYYHIPVYVHIDENEWLENPKLNGSAKYPSLPIVKVKLADTLISEEGFMQIKDFKFEIRHTPGHSPGSISFVFNEEGFAIVGDTLFKQSIGRTDLPGGNQQELIQSIHDRLLTLNDDIIIYPGHGSSTTIAIEKETNPYLNGF